MDVFGGQRQAIPCLTFRSLWYCMVRPPLVYGVRHSPIVNIDSRLVRCSRLGSRTSSQGQRFQLQSMWILVEQRIWKHSVDVHIEADLGTNVMRRLLHHRTHDFDRSDKMHADQQDRSARKREIAHSEIDWIIDRLLECMCERERECVSDEKGDFWSAYGFLKLGNKALKNNELWAKFPSGRCDWIILTYWREGGREARSVRDGSAFRFRLALQTLTWRVCVSVVTLWFGLTWWGLEERSQYLEHGAWSLGRTHGAWTLREIGGCQRPGLRSEAQGPSRWNKSGRIAAPDESSERHVLERSRGGPTVTIMGSAVCLSVDLSWIVGIRMYSCTYFVRR